MDITSLLTRRTLTVEGSVIRRITDLKRHTPGAIDFSIGQPEFPVDDRIKTAAIDAIRHDHNGYSPNIGIEALRRAVAQRLVNDIGWTCSPVATDAAAPGLLITAGTSAAILLACLAILNPGDEVIIPDPYFVIYPQIATLCDAKAVLCDTYPDFRMTAARVAPLITARTKMLIVNSPSNPAGVVLTPKECSDLLALCRERNILLVSDEIYDDFTFDDADKEPSPDGLRRCPSPARRSGAAENVLLVRGFGKTYGPTGWRMGYAAGPAPLIEQMTKLQSFTFVCAPTPFQHAMIEALHVDASAHVTTYRHRRDLLMKHLGHLPGLVKPAGAFYAYVPVPPSLGKTSREVFELARERKVLFVPGNAFSPRDTHFRVSLVVPDEPLERGLEIIASILK